MPDASAAIPDADDSSRRLGVLTGTLLVVANMIGTGVFTTTGFLVHDIGSPAAVLLAWLAGGAAALCGALAYAELGAALPRNGGEYLLLSRIYHPALGFLSGWASLVVGFSAPLAAGALAFGEYLHPLLGDLSAASPTGAWFRPQTGYALALIAILATMHAWHIDGGARFQNAMTLGKVLLIAGFSAAGMFVGNATRLTAASATPFLTAVGSAPFAIGLIYVSFSYGGWNSAVYLAGEIRRPERYLPLALIAGTTLVTGLYVALNYVFLVSAPAAELAASGERVGHVAAVALFGRQAGDAVSLLIVLGLVSSVSGLIMVGPRVYEAIGRDYPALKILAIRRGRGGPLVAIVLQATVAAIMVVTSSFYALLNYIGFTLSLFAMLTVLGVIVLRIREPQLPRPYRTWGYPLTPLAFVALELWMIAHSLFGKPYVALAGALTLASGWLVYAGLRWKSPRARSR